MTPSLSSATAESTGWKEARDPKKPKNCTHIVHILFLNGAADLNQEWTFFDNHTFCMVMATGANAHIAQPGGGEEPRVETASFEQQTAEQGHQDTGASSRYDTCLPARRAAP